MTALPPRQSKSEAGRLLGGHNLLTFVLAALAMILATFAWLLVTDGILGFADLLLGEMAELAWLDAAYTALYLFGWFLFVMPLWYGLRAIGLRIVREGRAEPGEIFCAFSSFRTLTRVWRASLWMVWRFTLAGALIAGIWLGAGRLTELTHPALGILFYPAALLLTPIPLLLTVGTHRIYLLMLTDPGIGIFTAVRTSMKLGYRGFFRTVGFWCSFIPWFALACATGGVLLVFYVLPYFILADTVRLDARSITINQKEINYV